MALTEEQFNKARKAGFTVDQIVQFEKQRGGDRQEAPKNTIEQQNLFGKIFDVPSAAIRSALTGGGYVQGATNPSQVPTFAEQGTKIGVDIASRIPQNIPFNKQITQESGALLGELGREIGSIADFATNPAEILISSGGASKIGKAGYRALSQLGKTRVAQSIGRFLQTPRAILKFKANTLQNVAEKAHRGVTASMKVANRQYGKVLRSIKGSIGEKDINIIKNKANEAIEGLPEEPFTQIKRVISRLDDTKSLSSEQLHNLKQILKKGIRRGVFEGRVQPDSIEGAKLKIYDSVDNALIRLGNKTSPGKYTQLKKEYTAFRNMIKDVNRVILEDGRPGEKTLRSDAPTLSKLINPGASGLTFRQREALRQFNRMLPPERRFLHDFEAWKRGKFVRDAIIGGIGISGIAYGARRKTGETAIPLGGGQ